ncbi:glycerol-3-phosphate dehydrogenase/oxidase [Rhodoferax sp. U2-2l]|uniref:glycerol-3-phosphate dehydrogenase/oxidase n=1 Tax=Rhodoferax sp. U2-2l TaxID=2884000 RepID=UPI001D09D7AE|nr:glycerol-3-phosphate dehydrogenase/oxidase [Rhodoferax sp. U2-2l]MCB8748311.1 glycerol-3-phosphate dehydrogenase/oxidase [Rhodoferax sp. U2-2l]
MASVPEPLQTTRKDLLARLAEDRVYDLAVVGGGATGLGVALDAAARGFSVVLLESHDFAKGTSSRSTKLVHGGVRYLAQGDISLVREALHERTTLLRNAPHLAQPLAFVVPSYHWWEAPFYGIGLTLYDILAGKAGLGKTRFLGPQGTVQALPTVRTEGLKGSVLYWDGQFNDARMALALARTAASRGALLVNYCGVSELLHEGGKIGGLVALDSLSGQQFKVRARCVVNATGVWVDALRDMDSEAHRAGGGKSVQPMVAPSQGVHMVVDREFLNSDTALMVPKTSDGRVLFAVPWLGKVILGTTDTPRNDLVREPQAFSDEVAFILRESARYLRKAPTRADVKSIWVGLRPLVKPQVDDGESTKALSREHTVVVSRSGLVTVTGGKWTTYRAMAEDVLQRCADKGLLAQRPAGQTVNLHLVGADAAGESAPVSLSQAEGEHSYGSEKVYVEAMPGADQMLAAGLTEAMVRFAARHEYALTVEDMLARRCRMLFLDARLAAQLAPRVGAILQEETGLDPKIDEFVLLTFQYLQTP